MEQLFILLLLLDIDMNWLNGVAFIGDGEKGLRGVPLSENMLNTNEISTCSFALSMGGRVPLENKYLRGAPTLSRREFIFGHLF